MNRTFRAALSAAILVAGATRAFAVPALGIQLVPQGQVEIKTAAGDWQPVVGRIALQPGQEVRTKDASAALITFSDGSKLALSPNALFSVEKSDRKETSLKLGLGKLRAYFAGYMSSRLSVRTPTAVAAVRGTEFELSADNQGASEVTVKEGHLEVSDTQGHQAVVTSEETLQINAQGMGQPQLVSLTDDRAQDAARPMAVLLEKGKDQARTMIEELRNRELKANEAQLGKDVVDAFGRRVRIEEYLLRPAANQFKLLFLSLRENRFDWGHLTQTYKNPIPNDLTQIPAIYRGSFLSKTKPSNWITNFEFFATNTVDSIRENIAFGDPVLINFGGYGAGAGFRYYPASIDFTQVLSGPGVAAAPGAAADGSRTQFRQTTDYGTTTGGLFTWKQYIVNNVGALALLDQFQLDPSNAADVAQGGCGIGDCVDHSPPALNAFSPGDPEYQPQAQFAGFDTFAPSFPNGKSKADFVVKTQYPDGSTLSAEKILVNDQGKILDFSNPTADDFNKTGNYNLEIVIGSSLFEGRTIDVLIAPEILSQKKSGTDAPSQAKP